MFTRSPKELALFVRNQRKKLQLSQAQVAERVGLKQKSISAFENKPESTKCETLFRILSAVNFDMEVILKNETTADKSRWQEEW